MSFVPLQLWKPFAISAPGGLPLLLEREHERKQKKGAMCACRAPYEHASKSPREES